MKYVYPAVFEYDSEAEAYNIYFPDLTGCLSCGYDLYHALSMAWDALNLHLFSMEYDGDEIPPASKLEDIDADSGFVGFVQYIRADTECYARLLQAANPDDKIDMSRLKPRQKRPERDDIPIGTVQRILEAAGISEEEAMDLFEDEEDSQEE